MKCYGCVVVFEPGTSRAQAEALIEEVFKTGRVVAQRQWTQKGFTPPGPPAVQEFDDRYGGPVWYIP
jgi:hypothetical protein